MARYFAAFSAWVAHATGKPLAFIACVLLIVIWAASGPFFGFSDTWQLIVNTGTTIITFLMVFLIQNTQNRDGAAIQAKLDELIRTGAAHNVFIGIENLTLEELDDIRRRSEARAKAEAAADRAEERANEKASAAAHAATS